MNRLLTLHMGFQKVLVTKWVLYEIVAGNVRGELYVEITSYGCWWMAKIRFQMEDSLQCNSLHHVRIYRKVFSLTCCVGYCHLINESLLTKTLRNCCIWSQHLHFDMTRRGWSKPKHLLWIQLVVFINWIKKWKHMIKISSKSPTD